LKKSPRELDKQLNVAERKGKIMKVYECIVCGYVYDETLGDPDHGVAAGTRWEDVPADWACPDCGVAKADFEMREI
jgi:rubredoxin